MPEIQNQTPKPEPKFILPQRRGYLKYLLTPIILIVLAAVAWILYMQFSKPVTTTTVPTPAHEDAQVKSGTSFYLAVDSEGDSNTEKTTRLYQYDPNATADDNKIAQTNAKFFDVLTKYNQPYTYIASSADHKFYTLNAATGKIEQLFELDQDPMSREVAVSDDKQWLAYARNYEGSEAGKSGGEIWLYNFETKEQKQLVKKTELGLYEGFSVLGWRNNDKEIIVSGLGGDAGATWGDIYDVSIATGELVKVNPLPEKDATDFLRGSLSPDGDKWLYAHCEKPDTGSTQAGGSNYGACVSGTELRTYDFNTKDIKTVYQNLRYDNNADKNSLRVIGDYKWEDNNTIVAAVPGAILEIALTNSKAEEVYTFDQYKPQDFSNHPIQLRNASKDQIVFNRDDNWEVYDRASNKLVVINKSKDKETIIHWLD
jgi:hypothetical protein